MAQREKPKYAATPMLPQLFFTLFYHYVFVSQLSHFTVLVNKQLYKKKAQIISTDSHNLLMTIVAR